MNKIILSISLVLLFAAACDQSTTINLNPQPAPVAVAPQPTPAPNSLPDPLKNPPVAAAKDSGIIGNIILGPVCPVETFPPQPACAPRPYQSVIVVKTSDGNSEVGRFASNSDGSFKFNLLPGNYLLAPQNKGQSIYPAGRPQNVTVLPHQFTKVTINYDTGIR